jgi:hypothetical protein
MCVAYTSAQRWAELRMVPPSEREDSLVLVAKNAFFDESGTHDGSEIVTMAGLIASYDSWTRWEIEWQKILAARGIKGFHCTDFMARQGEFENDWSNDERNEFMQRLCQAVSENIVVGLACSVFRSEYDATVTTDLQEDIRDPYYFGLYTCLYLLICWPHFKTRVTLPRELEFLFDRKPGYEGLASRI